MTTSANSYTKFMNLHLIAESVFILDKKILFTFA